MIIAIVGSRDYPNLKAVEDYVDKLPDDAFIVSGGARGVDRVAEQRAKQRGLGTKVFPANWGRFGKQAGFIRNVDIIKSADHVVAFWDGKSRGTLHSIKLAREWEKSLEIIPA